MTKLRMLKQNGAPLRAPRMETKWLADETVLTKSTDVELILDDARCNEDQEFSFVICFARVLE